MGGGKGRAPEPPDYTQLLQATERQIASNEKMFSEYMKFQEQAYAEQKDIADKVLDVSLPAMEQQAEFAKNQMNRYTQQGVPFEEEYLDKITNWDTKQRRDTRSAEARADIRAGADAARESQIRQLEAYGIDPSQTRSGALDATLRAETAAQQAMAGNQGRRDVELEGLEAGGKAIDAYRQLVGMSAGALSTGLNAGRTGQDSLAQAQGVMSSAYGTGLNQGNANNAALNAAYGTANSIYGNMLAGHELENRYSLGAQLGNLAGVGIGAAGAAGGFGSLFAAEGGSLEGRADGGQAPMAMPRPPSQGIPTDSVQARLTPGEFVLPDDVVRWEGEKKLQNQINKAREERQQTEAERARNQRAMGIPT